MQTRLPSQALIFKKSPTGVRLLVVLVNCSIRKKLRTISKMQGSEMSLTRRAHTLN